MTSTRNRHHPKSTKIALINKKGGVVKSTLALLLTMALRKGGHTVEILDYDGPKYQSASHGPLAKYGVPIRGWTSHRQCTNLVEHPEPILKMPGMGDATILQMMEFMKCDFDFFTGWLNPETFATMSSRQAGVDSYPVYQKSRQSVEVAASVFIAGTTNGQHGKKLLKKIDAPYIDDSAVLR